MKKMNLITTLFYCLISSLTIAQIVPPTPNSPGAGNCLQFDGTGDFIRIGNLPIFEGMAQLTLSAWVRTTTTVLDRPFVSKYFGSVGGISYVIRTSGLTVGRANFTVYTNTGSASFAGVESTSTINDGNWHHIVGVYDGADIRLYIDGVLQGMSPLTGPVQSGDEDLCFGDYFQAGAPLGWNFQGQIDEVRIWNTARTQAEIRDNMCHTISNPLLEPNLVGYWQMDAMGSSCGGVTQVCDMTGNGNDGTLN